MITELFTTTVENEEQMETVLVANVCGSLYSIKKVNKKWLPQGDSMKYHYEIAEWYTSSDTDIEPIEALKRFFEEEANVPKDFEFDHP